MLCYVMLCYVMLCYVMLCYVIIYLANNMIVISHNVLVFISQSYTSFSNYFNWCLVLVLRLSSGIMECMLFMFEQNSSAYVFGGVMRSFNMLIFLHASHTFLGLTHTLRLPCIRHV